MVDSEKSRIPCQHSLYGQCFENQCRPFLCWCHCRGISGGAGRPWVPHYLRKPGFQTFLGTHECCHSLHSGSTSLRSHQLVGKTHTEKTPLTKKDRILSFQIRSFLFILIRLPLQSASQSLLHRLRDHLQNHPRTVPVQNVPLSSMLSPERSKN